MDIFKEHEIFEINVLDKLKNTGLLLPLVFVGGTMLRLCYDLDRYSADLDFWFIKKIEYNDYLDKLKKNISSFYEITDLQEKFNTLLIELRSSIYPKRLKIEIRKDISKCDYQEKIAFSKYSNIQVILNVLTLEEVLNSKIEAALNRKDIRDFYDLEFLLKSGLNLQENKKRLQQLKQIAIDFKNKDFKVSLGSILEPKMRNYYIKNKFDYLIRKINNKIKFKN